MIKLIKSTFYHEAEVKAKLATFIAQAKFLSLGEECRKFENNFSQKQGRRHSVFVSSGSSANLILIQALLNLGRLKPGDKVGVSAVTWPTNIMPLIQLGLKPVLLDCETKTLNVSPAILEPEIKNLAALFLTNALGFCDDIKTIQKMCADNKVILLEDNCESLGSKATGELLGNFGLASTFSFFVAHQLSTIEGGMVCTDDAELAEMLVMARAHGWDRQLDKTAQEKLRQQNQIEPFFDQYTFYDLAYNARPTEISGFLGNTQIGYWDEIVAKRQENFKKFQAAISQNDDFISLELNHLEIISNFAMPVVCRTEESFIKYKKRFENAEVEIRPIIAGDLARQPFYRKYLPPVDLPQAKIIHQQGFYFPNNPELTKEEAELLVGLLRK